MKIKTVKKTIEKKIEDWIASIDEERNDVKKAIKDHAIVTGGCIASMLLKEEINDFDVYFETKESLKLVSEYYAKKITERSIKVLDGAEIETNREWDESEEDFQNQWESIVRRMNDKRVMLFIKGVNCHEVKDKSEDKKYYPAYFTDNAITLTDQIQIVIRFWGDAEEIHKNYDFVHATNYYHQGKLVLNQPALESLLTRELKYIGSLYPITSAIRVNKFIKRGFTINAGEHFKILYQVSELDLNDYDVLQEQLTGIDIAYFQTLLTAIQGKQEKKEPIGFQYMVALIDRIFN